VQEKTTRKGLFSPSKEQGVAWGGVFFQILFLFALIINIYECFDNIQVQDVRLSHPSNVNQFDEYLAEKLLAGRLIIFFIIVAVLWLPAIFIGIYAAKKGLLTESRMTPILALCSPLGSMIFAVVFAIISQSGLMGSAGLTIGGIVFLAPLAFSNWACIAQKNMP